MLTFFFALIRRALPRCFLAVSLAFSLVTLTFWPPSAWAAEEGPEKGDKVGAGLSVRALPGAVTLGLPAPAHVGFAAVAGVGLGWVDPIGAPTAGQVPVEATRLSGIVAATYSPLRELSFGVDVSGRVDWLSTPEVNAAAEPRLTARYLVLSHGALHLGIEADVRFVGRSAPSIDWAATSPSLAVLVGSRLGQNRLGQSWLGLTAGFHFDRSAQVAPDATLLSPADRITLGASSWPAVRLGLAGTHPVESIGLEILGEAVAELLVGDAAPPVLQSPLRLTVGARRALTSHLSVLGAVDVGLSARPDALTGSQLLPIEPRVAGTLVLGWTFGHDPAPRKPPPAAEEKPPVVVVEPAAPAAPSSPLIGVVVAEGGQPIPDVEVTLVAADQPGLVTHSAADGSFEFNEVLDAAEVVLRAKTAGYDVAELRVGPGAGRMAEVVLYPALPAGQVRGTVRDLRGTPIVANVTIEPGSKVVQVAADGSFALDLAPGEYTLRFEQEGFSPQARVIKVVERGVVILNIALAP